MIYDSTFHGKQLIAAAKRRLTIHFTTSYIKWAAREYEWGWIQTIHELQPFNVGRLATLVACFPLSKSLRAWIATKVFVRPNLPVCLYVLIRNPCDVNIALWWSIRMGHLYVKDPESI